MNRSEGRERESEISRFSWSDFLYRRFGMLSTRPLIWQYFLFAFLFCHCPQGLIQSGAWAIFDEFDRIELQVLSVVAQQISSIQHAIATKTVKLLFEDTALKLDPTCNIMVTMCTEYNDGMPFNIYSLLFLNVYRILWMLLFFTEIF